MKNLLVLFVTFGFILMFVAACGRGAVANVPGSTTPASSSGNVAGVHMGLQFFLQSSVTISKESNFMLMNEAADIHFISHRQWVNGSPKPETEPGAPPLNSVLFSGQARHEIGPWNTPGTYHLYCTLQNM